MKLFCSMFLIMIALASRAGSVDTVEIYSRSMHKGFKAVVIRPQSYESGSKHYPVVYLLHGYGGNYRGWVNRVPALKQLADLYEMIIVCPDGHISSWYFDSPVDSTMRYESYIGLEVPDYIDQNYRTIRSPQARAITGLSMGGHGGLFLGLRHRDYFGACGSMSGGVDMNMPMLHRSYDIIKRLGDTIRYASNWVDHSVSSIMEKYNKADSLAFIIDCGTEDFFYSINHALHEKMLSLKIPHDYIERPGKHDWNYWSNAVEFQLLFFNNYFKKYN